MHLLVPPIRMRTGPLSVQSEGGAEDVSAPVSMYSLVVCMSEHAVIATVAQDVYDR